MPGNISSSSSRPIICIVLLIFCITGNSDSLSFAAPKTRTVICDNKPFYLEVQTRKRIDDETDYFKRLHECIISKASKELETAGLLDLFDLEKADLSDESIEDFGDKDYILYKINKELNVQYVSWKQIVLKAMSAYIASSGTLSDINCFSVFGTVVEFSKNSIII